VARDFDLVYTPFMGSSFSDVSQMFSVANGFEFIRKVMDAKVRLTELVQAAG
jgi:hypothetical protein